MKRKDKELNELAELMNKLENGETLNQKDLEVYAILQSKRQNLNADLY